MFCDIWHPAVAGLEADFEGDLLVVRRHFAGLTHSLEAALFVEAAARQGQYIEMGDLMYDGRETWSVLADPTPTFEGFATQLGLNLDQVRQDVADPALEAEITADRTNGQAVGVAGTPAFFLQGQRVSEPASETGFNNMANRIQNEIDAVDAVFRLNRVTGELTVADTDRFANADFPLTLPVLVRDADGNEEEIDVTIERNEI